MPPLSSKLVGITKNLQRSSSELIKTTKLSINLANEEEHLRNIYVEVGKKVHEIYAYGGTLGGVFDEKYSEIKTSEEKIADLKKTLESVKGTKECPGCKKSVQLSYEFCPKCGADMNGSPAPAFATESNEQPVVEAPPSANVSPVSPPSPEKVCKVCGLPNDSVSIFCYSCGRTL